MTKVYHMTPYLFGDIGKAINEFVKLIPDNAWVCVRDCDTMFLTTSQLAQIDSIVNSDPEYDLIGCRTNRLKSSYQAVAGMFEEDSITKHISLAKELEFKYYAQITELPEPEVTAGIFLLFRKSLWNEIKFPERTIQFDMIYSDLVRKAGKKIGIAQGIYLLHLYRYGSEKPFTDIKHIYHCHDFNRSN